ncbi:MAG: hypothetical protein FJX48_04390 [Alphaproteobacteria bacterium]|nr:hypothetical protein [Alphaproteobacteria bacterium]
MTRLLIAALALGAAGFVNSAFSAPAAARLTPGSGIAQKVDDVARDREDESSRRNGRGDWWGHGVPSWRDTRPWSDDEWRRDPNWNDNSGDDGD